MQIKLYLSVIMGIIVSVAALFLAFYKIPFPELKNYLSTIDYLWLIPSAFLILATFILRVLRWRIILEGHKKISFMDAFHPLMIGFMMNCILPGRIGELARPTILRQKQQVPIATGLATVAAERLLDIVMLVILFGLVFGVIARQPDLEVSFGSYRLNSQTLQSVAWMMIRLIGLLLAALAIIIVPWSRKILFHIITGSAGALGHLIPSLNTGFNRTAEFGVGIIRNATNGLNLISRPQPLFACIALTAGIWGLTLLSYPVFALGCPGIQLDLKGWTTVMVVVCFFIALPSVPGFWGLWEAGGLFAFSLFGIPGRDALGFTLVNHAVQLIPVILVGWVSAVLTGINILKLFNKQRSKRILETPLVDG